jgi:hypothetical protein
MRSFNKFLEDMTSTASVVGTGDDSSTVIVRKKKKRKDATEILRRFKREYKETKNDTQKSN